MKASCTKYEILRGHLKKIVKHNEKETENKEFYHRT